MKSNFSSKLFNQDSFYKNFIKDLKSAKSRLIIESPFITMYRFEQLLPILVKIRKRGVRVVVNTKPFEEHNPLLYDQVVEAVGRMQDLGIEVFMTVGHHRKLAIIDEDILWEGSLNILSQYDSCEVMRRMVDVGIVEDMLEYISFENWNQ